MQSASKFLFSPVLSTVLENRQESILLAGAGIVHIGLNLVGLPGWVCPIRAVTGVPCPGCGLTTASVQFLTGDIAGSFHTHAFAPIFLVAIGFMLTALVLPNGPRQALVARFARFESKSGITVWVLLALFLYWGTRLSGSL